MEKDVKKVIESMRNKLELEVIKKEILEVLKLFKNDKLLGIDGFIVEFFFNFFGLILDFIYLIFLNVVLILVFFFIYKYKELF